MLKEMSVCSLNTRFLLICDIALQADNFTGSKAHECFP